MDFILVILLVSSIGLYKVIKSGNFTFEDTITLQEGGEVVNRGGSVPVGNNLLLKSDPLAFVLIIKDLGLMR